MIKIEQKIVTGGMKRTSKPMFRLRTNFVWATLFKAARHIEHCASTSALTNSTNASATTINNKDPNELDRIKSPQQAAAPPAVSL
jgi:hypothetical protein